MNKWQERADDFKECLKQLDDWLDTNKWSDLPEGVRRIICRGQNVYEEKIEKYEEWAQKENQAE
jgi:hypothetical protein